MTNEKRNEMLEDLMLWMRKYNVIIAPRYDNRPFVSIVNPKTGYGFTCTNMFGEITSKVLYEMIKKLQKEV
jgi:hypothetical protein